MIITQDKDREVYFFSSIPEMESWIEAIDVENGEYSNVCDEQGLIYKIELVKKPGVWSLGSIRVLPTDKYDRELPKKILSDYGKKFMDYKQLENIINSANSMKEAFDKMEYCKRGKKMFYDVSGTIEIRDSVDVLNVRKRIADALVSLAADVYLPDDNKIEFKGPFWCHQMHLLGLVSGTISIQKIGSQLLTVRYKISLRRRRLFCMFLNLFFVLVIALQFIFFATNNFPWPYFFAVTVLVWGWLYGMNWLIFSLRFRSFIKHVSSL